MDKSGHSRYSATITLSDKNVIHDVVLSEVSDALLGDINGDGEVNAKDSNLLKQMIAGSYKVESGSAPAIAADVNGDGEISAKDSNLLKQIISGAL